MGFSLEFDDLQKTYDSLVKIDSYFPNFLKDFLVEMAERVITKTKKRTPVDTGALRRSWVLGNVRGVGKNLEVEILNGMDYATEIEYGHRIMGGNVELGWYEGRFMLKISIDEVRRQIPSRWQSEFKQYCIDKGLKIE